MLKTRYAVTSDTCNKSHTANTAQRSLVILKENITKVSATRCI
jgi:hypothetical protein